MVTNEERREVARKLRKQANKLGPNMDAHEFANYTADVLDVDENMTWYGMELRLADLIEPEPERTCEMVDNGRELCCSACDWRHDYDDEPVYCSGCGAKVVSE